MSNTLLRCAAVRRFGVCSFLALSAIIGTLVLQAQQTEDEKSMPVRKARAVHSTDESPTPSPKAKTSPHKKKKSPSPSPKAKKKKIPSGESEASPSPSETPEATAKAKSKKSPAKEASPKGKKKKKSPAEKSPSANQIAWTMTRQLKSCNEIIKKGKTEWKDSEPPAWEQLLEKFESWSNELIDSASTMSDADWDRKA